MRNIIVSLAVIYIVVEIFILHIINLIGRKIQSIVNFPETQNFLQTFFLVTLFRVAFLSLAYLTVADLVRAATLKFLKKARMRHVN